MNYGHCIITNTQIIILLMKYADLLELKNQVSK